MGLKSLICKYKSRVKFTICVFESVKPCHTTTFLFNALTVFVRIHFSAERWKTFQKAETIFPSADLIASMYSSSTVPSVLLQFMYRPVNVLRSPDIRPPFGRIGRY